MKFSIKNGIPSYEDVPRNNIVLFHGRKDDVHFILIGPRIDFEKEVDDPVFFTRLMLSATTLYIFKGSEMTARRVSYGHLSKNRDGFIAFSDPTAHSKLDTLSWGNRGTSNCNGILFDDIFVI